MMRKQMNDETHMDEKILPPGDDLVMSHFSRI